MIIQKMLHCRCDRSTPSQGVTATAARGTSNTTGSTTTTPAAAAAPASDDDRGTETVLLQGHTTRHQHQHLRLVADRRKDEKDARREE
jgi:hypothetical protein